MFDSKELSLKDLIRSAMMKWKVIAVVTLLFAALLPFVAYKRGGSIMPESSENETKDENESQSADVLAVNISTLADLYKDFAITDEKIAKNEALGLDPDNLNVAHVQYHVVAQTEPEVTPDYDSLFTAYRLYFTGKDYVTELLAATGSKSDPALYTPFVSMGVENTDLIIKAACADDMDPDKLIQAIKDLAEAERVKEQSRFPHRLDLAGEGYSLEKNGTISQEQKNLISQKNNTNNSITGLSKNLTEEQIRYAKDMSEDKMTEEELKAFLAKEDDAAKAASKMGVASVVIYAVIGALIGLALVLFVLCELYIFSGKLHTERELSKCAGLFLFGTVDTKVKSAMDRQVDLVATSLKLLLQKNNVSHVVLTSSLSDKLDDAVVGKIMTAVNGQGLEASFADGTVIGREALPECVKAGNIILVEQIGRSMLSDIENEIRTAKAYGIKILGTVVLD